MRKLADSLLNLIFPPRCEVCKTNSQEILCRHCFSQIKFMKPHLGVHCVSAYDGVIKEAIARFKFKKRKRLHEPLGILLVHYLSSTPSLQMEEIDVIVPVPLHKSRHQERGFNQADLLAQVVSKYHAKPVVQALERHRQTQAQFDLKRNERYENIRDAFKVTNPHHVHDKRVLLLDDIYTTGSTIAECSRTLKQAGAKRVEVLTLSRAIENNS
ncbi:MAG: ComF family protein [bacterium]